MRLQAAGVPSGVVQNAADVIERDPNLRARHWVYLEHVEMGKALYDGPSALLSETPARLHRAAPLLGGDTDDVLENVLQLTPKEIKFLRERACLI